MTLGSGEELSSGILLLSTLCLYCISLGHPLVPMRFFPSVRDQILIVSVWGDDSSSSRLSPIFLGSLKVWLVLGYSQSKGVGISLAPALCSGHVLLGLCQRCLLFHVPTSGVLGGGILSLGDLIPFLTDPYLNLPPGSFLRVAATPQSAFMITSPEAVGFLPIKPVLSSLSAIYQLVLSVTY